MLLIRTSYRFGRVPLVALNAIAVALASTVAADISVTNTDDGGAGSLRQAIATAIAGETITFSLPANSAITLTTDELLVDKNLTINGPGAHLLTVQRASVSGTPNFRIFHTSGGSVTISGLTIANGYFPPGGGGILVDGGALTVINSAISGNFGGGVGGGGIRNAGVLTVTGSTISGNAALGGGGIMNSGTANLTNVTISGNSETEQGAGIYCESGTMTLTSSTISANSALSSGGGIYHMGGTINVRNSIIAGNTAVNDPDFSGTLTSQGYNLIGDATGTTVTGTTTGNQLNVNPMLGQLQDNGGPTRTHALLSGSTAIDKGHSTASTTDQRGLARPADSPPIANASGGDGSDIGAFEVPPDQLPGCVEINLEVDNNNDSGAGSLRSILSNACAGSTITFAPHVGGAITLTSGELSIDKNLTIDGPGANLLKVERGASAGNFRIVNVAHGSGATTISGLTIANGLTATQGGGILSSATLALIDVAVSGNTARDGGGIRSSGTLSIVKSTISGNSVSNNAISGSGGGIFNFGATLNLTNSTVSGNTATGPGGNSDSGGGIITNVGTVNLTNSTITGNSGDLGGGIRNVNGGTVRSRNTIIALNSSPSGPDVNGPITSQGFNLIGNSSGATITASAFPDQVGVTAAELNLGPLQNNGGSTETHALLINSRAIDKGQSSGASTDQRGSTRPADFPAIATAASGDDADIGAFELQPTPTPTPTPTPEPTATPTPTPTAAPNRFANISTRLRVETGDNVLIGGFIVTGSSQKRIIVRALGPSLPLEDKLANPLLELYDANAQLIDSNDNWQEAANAQEIIDSTISPPNEFESAILRNVDLGAYTAVVRDAADGEGVGLVEVYDLGNVQDSKLANIATRGRVLTGDNVMIGGLIITGSSPQRVIIRAIGPSLAVEGKLENPYLELFDANGELLQSNDNWRSDQEAEIIATTIPPSHDAESAIVTFLPAAAYTAIVSGVSESTGIALVEVYALEQ